LPPEAEQGVNVISVQVLQRGFIFQQIFPFPQTPTQNVFDLLGFASAVQGLQKYCHPLLYLFALEMQLSRMRSLQEKTGDKV